MLIALALLGVVLIVFGALVLLRYSDRPGGTIKWLGAEVTSKGAGLPLIALGVISVAFAAVRYDPAQRPLNGENADSVALKATGQQPNDSTCAVAWRSSVPRDRVHTLEVGMRDVEVIGSHQPLDQPFVLVLTENGQRIGALRMRLYQSTSSSAALFKIEAAVDAGCTDVQEMRNESRGGNPRELQNWDTVRLSLGAHQYDLRIGGEGNISVVFTRLQ
jgi:hypothetical protein